MKKILLNKSFYVVCILISGFFVSFSVCAEDLRPFPVLRKLLKTDSQNNEKKHRQCPSCKQKIRGHDSACRNCGDNFRSSYDSYGSDTLNCPGCHRRFSYDPGRCLVVCSACFEKNRSGSRFCSRCGAKLFAEILYVECSFCHFAFKTPYKYHSNSKRKRTCRRCHEKYDRQYKTCPYCKNSRKHHKKKKKLILKPYPAEMTASVGSFTKKNYDPVVKKFSIQKFTKRKDFSKVIVSVKKSAEYTVIINQIKVRHQGRWIDYAQGIRLNEGKNTFNVSVPRDSSELLIAFDHGQGSKVQITME